MVDQQLTASSVATETHSRDALELQYRLQSFDLPATPEGIRETLAKLLQQRETTEQQLRIAERFQNSSGETRVSQQKEILKTRFSKRNPLRDGDRFDDTLLIEVEDDGLAMFGVLGAICNWAMAVPYIFNSLSGQAPVVQYGVAGLAGLAATFVCFCPLLSLRWVVRTSEDVLASLVDTLSIPFRFLPAWLSDRRGLTRELRSDMQVISELPKDERDKLIEKTIAARKEEIYRIDSLIETLAKQSGQGDHVITPAMAKSRALTVDVPVVTSQGNLVESILASKRVPEITTKVLAHIDHHLDLLSAGEVVALDCGDIKVDAVFNGCLVKIIEEKGIERVTALKELHQEVSNLVAAYSEMQA